ncbi:hypothetical protein TRVL_00329 [Trypanosoma vivax]|nr:hypothetical protein TRVL_00329 [Trypanosoma vivax]
MSERLQNCQNQPKNRCYLPGTRLLTGGYGTTTLQGNWSEERADAGYYDGKAVLPTHLEKVWTTEHRTMTSNVKDATSKPVFDQETLVDIVDHKQRAYPSHQPHLDPHYEQVLQERFKTTMQTTFKNPQEVRRQEEVTVGTVIASTANAQAKVVILRLQKQLLVSRYGQSAFPGNVLRELRIALQRNDMGKQGMVNVEEAFRALSEVGLQASVPECTALVRAYDTKGDGTLPIGVFMDEMRGESRERRLCLVEKVYELLKKLCPSGIVRLRNLAELVDLESMRAVMNGTCAVSDAHEAFVRQWDASLDTYIGFERFLSFFRDVSFEIASDQEFELLMRDIWHLSGGNGNSANTSCRRVRVVHKNGRITTEEVKNDLDIRDSDPNVMERILANLASQGIRDVSKLEVLPKS